MMKFKNNTRLKNLLKTPLLLLIILCTMSFVTKANETQQLSHLFIKNQTKTTKINYDFFNTQKTKAAFKYTIDLKAYGTYILQLNVNNIFAPDFKKALQKEDAIPLTFSGKIVDQHDSYVVITVNQNYISGYVYNGQTTIYFEPLTNFIQQAKANEIIIYDKKDVLNQKIDCAHNHQPMSLKVAKQQHQLARAACSDYNVELVLVADYGMFQKYGSVTAVRNQLTSILNATQLNYDNEFTNPIIFTVVDDYIATTAAADLWDANVNNANTLLSQFAQSNFTDKVFDLASLWVSREIFEIRDGAQRVLAGLAYTGGICKNDQKYNLISVLNSTQDYLETVLSHEVGHNFSAAHDADGTSFIMSEGELSSTWSTASLESINNFYPNTNCLCSTQFIDLTAIRCTQFSFGGNTYKTLNVQNTGNTVANNIKVGLFLSEDNTITTEDYLVSSTTINTLNPNETKSAQLIIDFDGVDWPCGTYSYGFLADAENTIAEGNELNNVGCVGTHTIANCPTLNPDLTVENCSSITISGNTINTGNVSIKNIGNNAAASTLLGVYLSSNTIIDDNDYLIIQSSVPQLTVGSAINQIRAKDISAVNPPLPAGTYYVGFLADKNNTIAESNENNNTCYDNAPRFTVTYACKNVEAHNYNPAATYNNKSLCETCTDGIKNGDETDIDCGGSCPTTCPTGCQQTDREALIALYNSTNGANWTNPWNLSEPVENWNGITLNSNGCVEQIYFFNNNLNGSLPEKIGQLGELKSLQLRYNNISGDIPTSIGNLSKLERLNLSINNLTGSVPLTISNLSSLKSLYLGYNKLIGKIPASLGNLNKLTHLDLYANDLIGNIPAELGNLINLEYLSLYHNKLSGNIPLELGNLTKLKKLNLMHNQLSGSIPYTFGNLSNLKELKMYSNQLTGNIPWQLGKLSFLEELSLSNNQLSGIIPLQLGSLTNLEELSLSSNQLTGFIPAELGDLNNLSNFYIGRNNLSGCFDAHLQNLCNARVDVNTGNNFYTPWVNFCENDNASTCQPPACLPTDANTLLNLPFDNTLEGVDGERPLNYKGLSYDKNSIQYSSLKVQSNYSAQEEMALNYPATNNINLNKGTIEAWINHTWDGDERTQHTLVQYGKTGGLLFYKDTNNYFRLLLNRFSPAGFPEINVGTSTNNWASNQWKHVAATWGNGKIILYIDGEIVDQNTYTQPVATITETELHIGSEAGSATWGGLIEQLRISDKVRTKSEINTFRYACENDRIKPTNLISLSNYPNPFKGHTNIEFDLPTKTNVTLKIYNNLGKQIMVLLKDAALNQGKNTAHFNAKGLPAGIYYYSIQNNDTISLQKMILMK